MTDYRDDLRVLEHQRPRDLGTEQRWHDRHWTALMLAMGAGVGALVTALILLATGAPS